MSILIKNGTIVTAGDIYKADLFIDSERIKKIGLPLESEASTEIVDANGKYVLPGLIDVHTHLDMPFGGTVTADDFYSGTVAAAYGGTTCIVDFCVQSKGQSLNDALDIWRAKAKSKAVVDYSFHIAITDLTESVLHEIPEVISVGVTSFKCFLAYKGVLMIDDGTLFRLLKMAKEHGGLVSVHAENGDVIDILTKELLAKGSVEPVYHAISRPPECEDEATGRAILLAKMADSPIYIVHLSSVGALKTAMAAKQSGQSVFVETCPHYLYFNIHDLERPSFEGAKFVMSPPLRPPDYQEVLWSAVINGGIDVIATDHGTFKFKGQKDLGKDSFAKIPNGIPGVEERALAIYQGGVVERNMSLNRFVDLLSATPARIFGLYPRKGTIAVGADADLLIFDPSARGTLSMDKLHYNSDYCPYEGMEITGGIERVFVRGKPVIEVGNLVGQAGSGQFIQRSKFSL